MSIDLDWSALDANLTASVVSFLTTAFSSAARPNYLGEITVTSFSFGDSQPQVELIDLQDVCKEFLEADLLEEELELQAKQELRRESAGMESHGSFGTESQGRGTNNTKSHFRQFPSYPSSMFLPGLHHSLPPNSHRSSYSQVIPPPLPESNTPSLQLSLQLTYTGNLSLALATSLLINYPSPAFMSLPLSLSITSISFSALFIVAIQGDRRRVHISILNNGQTVGEKHDIIADAIVDTEVGQVDKHVLKNVGKVEKFVLEVLRGSLESELVFPNFQTIVY